MVAQVQNTFCSIFRGAVTNRFGDVQETNVTPLMQHVPASVIETVSVVMDPATQTPLTVRVSEGQVPSWTGVLNSDRLQDETTGDMYMVIEVVNPPTIIGAPVDLRLTLRRITATGD